MKSKVFVSVLALIAVFGFASQAKAQEKIALVSLQRALNEVEAGKTAKAKLQKDFEARKKQIDAMKAELDTMSRGLEKEKMVLSADALKTKQQTLQTKFIELQTKAADYERELKTQEAQSAQKILGSLRQVVTDIAGREGYTLVIENSAETVLYARSAEDITPKVISAFNSKK